MTKPNKFAVIVKENKEIKIENKYKDKKFNRVQTVSTIYHEDDRDTIPCIFYNQLKTPDMKDINNDYHFALVDSEGKIVDSTVVDLKLS